MDKLKIFEIEERLGKISALILNCIVCSENDVEIIDLLEFLQNEYEKLIDEFIIFQKEIMPLVKSRRI